MIVTLFDTETDALIKTSAQRLDKQPKIVEIFCLKLRQTGEGADATFEELTTLQSFFDYGKPLPEITKKITGIRDEDLIGAPTFAKLGLELVDFIGTTSDRVVAHNLSYDKAVLEFELERSGWSIVWPELVCTVEQTEHIKGYRLSLTALHQELFGEEFTGAHRAETDVRAMAKCYMELVRRNLI